MGGDIGWDVKIVHLSHLASRAAPTGAEHSLALLAAGLAAKGHEVAVGAPGPWALEEQLRAAGVEVATIPLRMCWLVQYGAQPWWRQLARAARYAQPDRGVARLRAWLQEQQPDVVHVNCLPNVHGATVARSLGLPVVWHLREILPPGPRRRWFAGRLRHRATRVVAVSEAVSRWLEDEGLGDTVDVVHNAVALPERMPGGQEARATFNLPEDAVVVGLFSQLVPHKGGMDFVRAGLEAAAVEPTLHFLIAGNGPEAFMARLRHEIARSPAASRFRVVPPQPEIWPLLAASDIVALATLWPDPLPRVVMEAMAAGLPVVAYRGGGVSEMLTDGATGWVVEAGDVEALGRRFVTLARSADERARFGAAGRRRAARDFTVARHVDRMLALFASARLPSPPNSLREPSDRS
jgi:glycosyltransferase involved in cell wall biosynthesis